MRRLQTKHKHFVEETNALLAEQHQRIAELEERLRGCICREDA